MMIGGSHFIPSSNRSDKHGDRRRRRREGRIKDGGGDGGDPVRGPPGRLEFSSAPRPPSGGDIRRRAGEAHESARLLVNPGAKRDHCG